MFDSQRNNLAAVCSETLLVFAKLTVLNCRSQLATAPDARITAQNAVQSSVCLFGVVTFELQAQKANFVPKGYKRVQQTF